MPGKSRTSIRYLAFEPQFQDDNNNSDNDEDVETQNITDQPVSQEIGKVLPQTDDLAWIHLINWLDEDSDVHIIQYIISSFKRYKSKSLKHILSPLKLKKVQRNLEDGMKAVLNVAENLVPEKIKDFYMYIEDEKGDPSECILLDETAKKCLKIGKKCNSTTNHFLFLNIVFPSMETLKKIGTCLYSFIKLPTPSFI